MVFVLAEANWEENKRIRHIWLSKTDGSVHIQLTNGTEGESRPRWSPDGSGVAFIAKRGNDEEKQIYVIDPHGGEAERVTEHETAVSMIEWAPDGASLYFLAADAKTEEEKTREEKEDDVPALDEDYKQHHLWRVSADERVEERITEGDYSILGYRFSLDGSRIALHRAPTPLFDDSDESEVWVMDANGEDAARLTDNAVVE